GRDLIRIKLAAGHIINLDYHKHYKERNYDKYSGIDVSTIRVHNIKNSPGLLHIEWLSHSQGMGRYTSYHFIICPKINPVQILLRKSGSSFGRQGIGNNSTGYMKALFKNGKLIIKRFNTHTSTTIKPKILHHTSKDYYQFIETTKWIRYYNYTNKKLVLDKTEFTYKVQKEDRLKEILTVFELKKEWMLNLTTKLIPKKDIKFNIPLKVDLEGFTYNEGFSYRNGDTIQ
ncbi:MAG: hypothetical protein HRT89_14635, partial [Lentisphaeria bacterium]|nr:hypothetical protein [Lentisphaeria bacterium]NQZ69295.1 hypothetical protein [Lentisphaeria bacterium]